VGYPDDLARTWTSWLTRDLSAVAFA
jgi:hypothetical protein